MDMQPIEPNCPLSATPSRIPRMDMQQPRSISPQQPLGVTLEAQQWETVLRIISEAPMPHRVSDPLLREIQRQCMMASASRSEALPDQIQSEA
jgi:hypothetical protein